MIIRDIIHKTTQKLEAAGIPSARLDAEVMLAFCLNCDRLEFIKNPETKIHASDLTVFDQLVTRRLCGEPVAYITGRKDFWSFTLEINPSALIPRPDTEVIVEEALAVWRAQAYSRPSILDVGTGSGAIALALAKEISEAEITATDISAAALQLAQKNARALGVQHSITFLRGNLFQPVHDEFDMIISNPPYIGTQEYETLDTGVRDYEPREALWAGQSGLEFYEKLVYQARNYLKEKGWLLLEIGAKQAESVHAIMADAGFYDQINLRADYAGLPRVIKGRRK